MLPRNQLVNKMGARTKCSSFHMCNIQCKMPVVIYHETVIRLPYKFTNPVVQQKCFKKPNMSKPEKIQSERQRER